MHAEGAWTRAVLGYFGKDVIRVKEHAAIDDHTEDES